MSKPKPPPPTLNDVTVACEKVEALWVKRVAAREEEDAYALRADRLDKRYRSASNVLHEMYAKYKAGEDAEHIKRFKASMKLGYGTPEAESDNTFEIALSKARKEKDSQ